MSDDDDDDFDIIDDIKALEHALAQEPLLQAYENENDNDDNDTLIHNLSSIEKIHSPISNTVIKSNELCDTVDYVIEANTNLHDAYKCILNAVEYQLDECIKRQHEVDYQIQLISRGGKANWRVPYIKAGQPYFKDESSFPATSNNDQLMKLRRDEFPIVYSRLPSKWSKRGRVNLWKAARANASLKYLDIMRSLNRNNNDSSDMDYIIPSDFLHVLKTLGDTELDWLRISVKDMKGRYSWQACKSMWDLYLKPTINREKWQTDEDKKLISLAQLHDYQNWDLIAKELSTQRSCYQCFVRYNTIVPPSSMNSNADVPWTPKEDQLIIELVEKLRTGDTIPWSWVTFYIGNRTKSQIYCHWKYTIDPSLKKGRFTPEEDQILLNAVEKYGKNFPRIASECFSHRSTAQLSNRFHLLMLKTDESYNTWTIAEDKRLLTLYEEFGKNWSVIGNIMNKDRTYVRHHHAALTRNLSRGIKLIDLPRKKNLISNDDSDTVDENDIELRIKDNTDVQLMRYFQSIHTPIARPGRKRKYHTREQLESRTKQLHDVFNKLNVNINIPDNLDDYEELTPMDKQLLISYKESFSKRIPKYTPDQIEEYRVKMFCDNNLDDNTTEEHFIPPAPFGLFQTVRKRGNSRRINGNTVCDNCNLELIMELDTPKNIIEMLNDDEIKTFDKITLLFTNVCNVYQYPGRFKETYIKPLINTNNIADKVLNSQAGTSHSFMSNDELMIDLMNETTDKFIEPCYSTLIGYQYLLNIQNMMDKPIPDDLINEKSLCRASRDAIQLLKNRFLTLFKYPIGMARVPIDYKIIRNDDEDDDDDQDEDDENKYDIDDEGLNEPKLENNSPETSTTQCDAEINELKLMNDVEVSMPVRLSLNMVKRMRGKNKNKIHRSNQSKNEL